MRVRRESEKGLGVERPGEGRKKVKTKEGEEKNVAGVSEPWGWG